MTVAIIAAVARNGVIGRAGTLPWRLSGDFSHFRRLTVGHTLIIGRRTHESIGRVLPDRRTIVVAGAPIEGVITAPSLLEALALAQGDVFLAGGARVYAEGMAQADLLHITRVDAEPEGDTRFPPIDPNAFALRDVKAAVRGPNDDHAYDFATYARFGAQSIDAVHPDSL